MTTTTVLADDWALLRSVTGLDDVALAEEVAKRGDRHADESSPGEGDARDAFVHTAAAAATYRFDIVVDRGRHRDAIERARTANERAVALDRDVVPPLKGEAKALRAQLRELGVDPSGIEPGIDWSTTLMVDDYAGPRYESPEERRRAVVSFFARRDGER